MRADELTTAYLQKAAVRLESLMFFRDREAYSDVVREAQSVVELTLKALLRAVGIEVPKIHDVGRTLLANQDLLPESVRANLDEIRTISKRLRKERELAFYGAEDFVPTAEYDLNDATLAIEEATLVFGIVKDTLSDEP